MSDHQRTLRTVAEANGWTRRVESPWSWWSESYVRETGGQSERIHLRWRQGRLTDVAAYNHIGVIVAPKRAKVREVRELLESARE
ncbi:hypothetical protein PBI_SEBATA_49 [Mycobacterium phage Sebata]|uniref:Uncharacterized protein n=6 Tax=Bixzunavirus TaxID=680114 RepID=Q853M9_BPMBZ|nr:gp48 [Mycobacterium phage Bxz1]YP_009221178.1 hypothetical protein AWH68_gp048 [Mycobacterium phage Breeniome]YP_009608734.1 hypothetical protein FDI20_gp049 [Mycobacterium phage Sebata]YP_010057921.1 hypothetical protein KHO62_gp047 [Mycobacterium phage NoodleTree]YP_010510457.1 hypothetical protein OLP41_gp049 [Mycobacterium phage I3]AER49565.1 hypothetical protein PIO_51 [Mycobacterium phage Pio]AOZ63404.1 hypothetical protein SEA_GABRIEL_48 [Mycobacterium phage Gabriel]AYD85950.1 hypo